MTESNPAMLDSKNFTIGVLTTTAVVLLAALIIIATRPPAVQASGMTATGGEYVLTVGSDPSGDEELLYLVDSVAERLIVYRFDAGRRRIQVVQPLELKQLRDAAEGKKQKSRKGPVGKRRWP